MARRPFGCYNGIMRIGINASFLRKPNTGIAQVTSNFLKELIRSDKGRDEFVLYLEEELPKGFRLPKNFSAQAFLPMLYKRDDLIRKIWWEKRLLPKKADHDGCDIFLSLYQCPTVMPKGIRHLMLVHDVIPKLFPEYLDNARKRKYQALLEKGIAAADRIAAVSKHTEKDIIRQLGIGADRISVDHIDVDEIYKKKPSKEAIAKTLRKYRLKPGYILAGGGMETRKNIDGLLRAYKSVIDRNSREHFAPEIPPLAIFGKLMPQLAPLATDAEKLVKELNLTRQVRLLGLVPQDRLPVLYSQALFFAYPSRYEGFGMPVLEAMSQGTAVMTSKVSSLPEVGSDGVIYCDPNDPKDMAMVMRNLIVNRELRESVARRGKERSKRFSWKAFTKRLLAIAKEIE